MFKLEAKKYHWPHFFIIPFQCDVVGSTCFFLQKLGTALAATLEIPFMAKMVDSVIKTRETGGSYKTSLLWFVLLMLCIAYRRIASDIGFLLRRRIAVKAENTISKEFSTKIAKLKYRYIEDEKTLNLINRLYKDLGRKVGLMLTRSFNLMVYALRIISVLVIISTQICWVGMVVIVLCIPLVLLAFKSGEKSYKSLKSASEYQRKHLYLSEVLSGREAVDERTIFGFSNEINKQWYEQFEKSRKVTLKSNTKLSMNVMSSSMVTSIFSGIIMLLLVHPAVTGQISEGMFVSLSASVYSLIEMMGFQMVRSIGELSTSNEYLKEFTIFAALDTDEGVLEQADKQIEPFKSLEFKNISFKYPNSEVYILKNVSFLIEKDKHYSFVGANGSGKTTITKLILGLYDNYEGEILINDVNIKSYTPAQIKAFFVTIFQDFAKYFVSIEDNIVLGNMDYLDGNSNEKDEKVKEITESLGIYDEMKSRPNGFETMLGKIHSDGVDLSGGQWQRVAMARVLISSAYVQILDEPTASLDPINESKLYELFGQVSKNKTTIFISHRLGSTKLADKIFVLDNGSIIEEGTHNALIERNGVYSQMYNNQKRWYE
jgi:ABC-type multidrug transport system fused ATPase/permease subunit